MNVRKVLDDLKISYVDLPHIGEMRMNCNDPSCPKPIDHLYMNVATGLWNCKRCDAGGNFGSFLSGIGVRGSSEISSLLALEPGSPDIVLWKDRVSRTKRLINEGNLKIVLNLPEGSKMVGKNGKYPTYLNQRKIPFGLAFKMGVRLCNSGGRYNGRLIFPIFTEKNRSFVAYRSDNTTEPKTLDAFGIEKRRLMYSYDFTNRSNMFITDQPLIIVEGVFDCLRLLLYGVPAMALLGSRISQEQAMLLTKSKFNHIVFMLDGDVAIDEYHRKLKHSGLISGKKLSCALIGDEDRDPDSLSNDEVVELLKEIIPLKTVMK